MRNLKDVESQPTTNDDEYFHRALMWLVTAFIPLLCLLGYLAYDLFKIFK